MTVSFDGLISSYKIAYHERLFLVRYDASTGLYTADVSNPTKFDLFGDDATVGDWIGWGWSRGVWHDLALTIGTALAGSGITLAWEYSSYNPSTGAIVWTSLTVTDGTSGLTTSGTIAFSVPDTWRSVGNTELVAGLSGYVVGPMIRCRIAAATSVSEGGAVSAKADAKDYAVTVVGSETPASVYTADVAAGWGRVTKAGSHLYAIDANLRIGDGVTATTFTISAGAVLQVGNHDVTNQWTRSWYRRRTIVAENTGDTWAMGVVSGSDYYDGGTLIYCPYGAPVTTIPYFPHNYWKARISWAASKVQWIGEVINAYNAAMRDGLAEIQNCILDAAGQIFWISQPANSKLTNAITISGSSYLYVYDSDLAISNLTMSRGTGVLIGISGVTLQNVDFGSTKRLYIGNNGQTGAALDCRFSGVLADQILITTNCSAFVRYSVSVSVLNSSGESLSGFHVRLVDSAGTVIYSGVYSSAIVCTVYTAVNVSGTVTRTNLNPVEIWVSKPGYLTVYRKFTLDNDSRKVQVTLLHSPTPGRGSLASQIR
jgi:hypothetical protein